MTLDPGSTLGQAPPAEGVLEPQATALRPVVGPADVQGDATPPAFASAQCMPRRSREMSHAVLLILHGSSEAVSKFSSLSCHLDFTSNDF